MVAAVPLPPPHRCLLLLVLALPAGLAGCKDPSSALSIRICGRLDVPSEIDALRVVVLNEDRSEASAGLTELGGASSPDMSTDGGILDLGVADAGVEAELADAGTDGGLTETGPACEPVERPLEARLELPPGEGHGWVQVIALHQGVEVARAEVRHPEEGGALVLALERGCLGITCPLGQTCVAGACELVPEDGDAARCEACP